MVECACATCDLFINSFVRSPTNALPLFDWIVMGQPCLAIHTFIKWSHVSSIDAVMQGAASAYFVKDQSLPALDCSPWPSCISSDDQFAPPHWILMTLLTAGETSISWGPSPVDMTSMQRSTFHRLSSNQAIRTVSVSYYTLCPRLDGPSDLVNERAIRFDTTAVALSHYICKGFCPPPCVCRPRFLLYLTTTGLFFLQIKLL